MAVPVHNQPDEQRQHPGRQAEHQGKRSWERDMEEAASDPATDERNYDTGPKVDPRAPGASNNGDLGRRMYGGDFPSEPDRRTHRQKKEEWPTKGFRPGSEDMSQEAMPQGQEPRTQEEVDEDVALTEQKNRDANRSQAGGSRDAAYAGSTPAPASNPAEDKSDKPKT